MRRVLLVILVCGLTAGATAIARDDDTRTPYELPEPAVHSAELLRLPSDARCVNRTLITVRVLPPPGAVMGLVVVKVGAREGARLTGVPRAASGRDRSAPSRSSETRSAARSCRRSASTAAAVPSRAGGRGRGQ